MTFLKHWQKEQNHLKNNNVKTPISVIALVGCVKQKLHQPAPARDMYTSTLFRFSKAYAEANSDKWYILSAKYGLVHPGQIINPYEETLNNKNRIERRDWARDVHRQLHDADAIHDYVSFLWLAGQVYQRDLSILLANYHQSDPLRGLQIGKRLAWLKAHQ